MNRRRIRKYRSQRGNSGVKFLGITGIMMVAVICGYLTARFIIAPLLGYDTEVLKLDFPSKLTGVFQSGADTENGGIAGGEDKDNEKDSGNHGENRRGGSEEESGQNDKSDENSKTGGKQNGFALQFGLFSTRQRAEELCENLNSEGIDARVKKTGDQYKVLSSLIDTKDEALNTLKNTESEFAGDIFITRL